MLSKRRLGGLAVAAAALLATTTLMSGTNATATVPSPGSPHGRDIKTVTLITGDRVTVFDGATRASVQHGPGRAKVSFLTQRVRGHLQVVPTDVINLLHADRLDPRLFDVTTLLASGYDDHASDLPLLVSSDAGKGAAVGAALDAAGAHQRRDLPALGGAAVRQSRAQATAFWDGMTAGPVQNRTLRPGVSKVWLDGRREPTLDTSVPQIGAPAAWQAGLTGAGSTVAVLDTGIDAPTPISPDGSPQAELHRGRRGRPGPRRPRHPRRIDDRRQRRRLRRHVPGRRAGRTPVVGQGVLRRGLPGIARFSPACSGRPPTSMPRVVNVSLGGDDTPETDPLEDGGKHAQREVRDALRGRRRQHRGAARTVSSPGSADAALTVGAVTKTDDLAEFSSQGPRIGDSAIKPDITAPGVDDHRRPGQGRHRDGRQARRAVRRRFRHLDGDATRRRRRGAARPATPGLVRPTAQGHTDGLGQPEPDNRRVRPGRRPGRRGRAIGQSVTTEPGQREPRHPALAAHRRPGTDQDGLVPQQRPAPVTLNLAVAANGPDGTTAPAGMFRLDRQTVTVPAGGDAASRLPRTPGPATRSGSPAAASPPPRATWWW